MLKWYLKVFVISKIVILGVGLAFNDFELLESILLPLEDFACSLQEDNIDWESMLYCILPTFTFHFTIKGLALEVLCWYCGTSID